MEGALSAGNIALLAAAAAVQFAQGRSADELARMAAFFTVLGDNLALMALDAPSDDE